MMENINDILDLLLKGVKISFYIAIVIFVLSILYNVKISELMNNIHSSKTESTSWTRSMGTFVIIFTMGLAIYQISKTGVAQETLILGLIGIAFGGKVGQKFAEKSSQSTSDAIKKTEIQKTTTNKTELKSSPMTNGMPDEGDDVE